MTRLGIPGPLALYPLDNEPVNLRVTLDYGRQLYLYDINYSYLIKIICRQLYDIKYFYQIQIIFILLYCTIGPKCCVWKNGVRRKRNTQTRNLRKKNSSRFFYSLGLQRLAARKVRFMRSSSLFSLVATVDVMVAGLLTRSCQSYCDRLVMTGWGLLNVWRTCLGPGLQLQKSPYLISYIEIFWNKSKVPECSVTLVKTIVKHMTIHVWLYKNHVWTL